MNFIFIYAVPKTKFVRIQFAIGKFIKFQANELADTTFIINFDFLKAKINPFTSTLSIKHVYFNLESWFSSPVVEISI